MKENMKRIKKSQNIHDLKINVFQVQKGNKAELAMKI